MCQLGVTLLVGRIKSVYPPKNAWKHEAYWLATRVLCKLGSGQLVTYCFIQLVFLLKDLSFPKEGLLVVWLNSQNLLLGHFSCVEKVTFNHLSYACQGCVPSRKFHLCLDTKVTYEYNFWINARYENNLKSYKQLQWISHKINPAQAPVPCCWRSSLYPLTIVGYLLATGTWPNMRFLGMAQNNIEMSWHHHEQTCQ